MMRPYRVYRRFVLSFLGACLIALAADASPLVPHARPVAAVSGCLNEIDLAADVRDTGAVLTRAAQDPDREGHWLVLFEAPGEGEDVIVTLGTVSPDGEFCRLGQEIGRDPAWSVARLWHTRGKGPGA